jgi:PKD repeat protein
MFLLASLILLGGVVPFVARAAQADASVALASEAAMRAAALSPPMITAPVTASSATGQSLTLTATATDPDAGDVLTITASGAPAGLVLNHTPSVSPATATLSGTLGLGDVGSWSILWQVSDGTFSANTTTSLTVDENHAPEVTAPASVPGAVAVDMSFPVLVSDPDGDPIHSLTPSALPAGANFSVNTFLTSGDFDWTPSAGQEGTYTITWTVESGSPPLSASTTTELQIGPEDVPPVVVAPGTVNGRANHLITFTAACSDPHGEAITLFTLIGAQNTPLPDGAVFTPNATNTSGTFTWTPTQAQTGTVSLRWKATDAEPFPLSTGPEQYTTKIVVSADRAPVVTAPASVAGAEGAPLAVNVSAADPDGDAITSLTTSPLPLGATFSSNGAHTAGTLDWTPDYNQAGTYNVTFTASNLVSGSAVSAITVASVNRAPTANPGGPYSGVAGSPLLFDGSASSDPDGDALTYAWDFGDGATGTGSKPSHTYAAGGVYPVSLTVTDAGAPPMSGSATTTATITPVLDARIFTTNSNRTIKLKSGKAQWCAQIEPINTSFDAAAVVVSSIRLSYAGQQIAPITGKGSVVGDGDENGIADLGVCFAKSDLRTLFAGLPNGHQTVTVMIQGSLLSGALIRGSLDVDVLSSGGGLLADVSPNPLNPQAKLSFVTQKAGALRVRLYDLSGRLVRTLADEASAAPGNHEMWIDGRSDNGSRLASGVYFYRIDAADGESTGRFAILK